VVTRPVPLFRILAALLALFVLSACQEGDYDSLAPKAQKDLPEKVLRILKDKGMTRTSPIMIRVFKEENVLEVWKRRDTGRYDIVMSYPICKWSGKLGPKYIEGDRQAPEGFYTITPGQMNPNSKYHLAFNTGYPNAFDRAHGRGGTHLMVHGACSSSGCYSMSDPEIEQIFAFARDAFRGGQKSFQMQAFPFRLTAENMARYRDDPNIEFWKGIKPGYDLFELTRVPPRVGVCEKKYTFAAGVASGDAPMEACDPEPASPALSAALQSYNADFSKDLTSAIEKKSYPAPAPTVQGIKEAKLVADWSKRRLRGEKVSRQPPSLSPVVETVAPVVAVATADATAIAAPVAEATVTAPAPDADRFGTDQPQVVAAAAPAPQTDAPQAADPQAQGAAAKEPRTATADPQAAAVDPAPAVPSPNPNAPSLTAPSPDVVPLPPKKKPWWKLLGD
jgi:murein L,D-transpeptidase YafK